MSKASDVLLELVQQYDKIRAKFSEVSKDKDELSNQIKALLGDKKEAACPGYRVTYRYDKNKEVEQFDEEKFQEKDPKKYKQYLAMLEEIKQLTKKYTKINVVEGARRLIVETDEQ